MVTFTYGRGSKNRAKSPMCGITYTLVHGCWYVSELSRATRGEPGMLSSALLMTVKLAPVSVKVEWKLSWESWCVSVTQHWRH